MPMALVPPQNFINIGNMPSAVLFGSEKISQSTNGSGPSPKILNEESNVWFFPPYHRIAHPGH
jgi:hypothetical protein